MTLAETLRLAQSAAGAVASLANVSTDSPVLAAGTYPMLVTFEAAESKTPGKYNLIVTCRTLREENGEVDGESTELKPGYSVKRWYPLQASPKQSDPNSWLKDIKRMLEGVFDEGELPSDASVFDAIELAATKTRVSMVTIKIEPAAGEYGRSNRPQKFARPDADAEAEFLELAEALNDKGE